MNSLYNTVQRCVLASLQQRQRKLGRPGTVALDTPVFASGLLDSLALLALIAELEASTTLELDMLRFDPAAVHSADDLVDQLLQALPQQA